MEKKYILGLVIAGIALVLLFVGIYFFMRNEKNMGTVTSRNTIQGIFNGDEVPLHNGTAESSPTTDTYRDDRGKWERTPTALTFIGNTGGNIFAWDILSTTQSIQSKDGDWKKTPSGTSYTGSYGTYTVTPTTITFDSGDKHLEMMPTTTTVKNGSGTATQTPTTKVQNGDDGNFFEQTPTTKSLDTGDESWTSDSDDESLD